MRGKIDADGLEAAARIFWESWPHGGVPIASGRPAVWSRLPEVTRRQVRVCVLLAIREYLDAAGKADCG